MSEPKTGVARWKESTGTAAHKRRSATDKKRRIASLVVLLVACVVCLVLCLPPKEAITRGLWLGGGTAVTMSVEEADGDKPSTDDLARATSIITSRLNDMGISESSVVQDGETLVVSLPQDVDGKAVMEAIGGPGKLEFVVLDEIGDADALAKINAGGQNVPLEEGTYTAFLTGDAVQSATVTEMAGGGYAISLAFDAEGAQTFADVTRELAADGGGSIAIVLDGRVLSAPGVSQEIAGGEVSISGDFTYAQAHGLKAVLETEALPVTLAFQGSEGVGPLLGNGISLIMLGVVVVAIAAVAVVGYVRYGKLAVIPAGSMVVFSILLLGLMGLFSRLGMFVLTLPGVAGGVLAGVVTTLASWLVVRRFHDKVVAGGTIKGASVSAVREGLRSLGIPCAVLTVAGFVLLFVPNMAAHAFGMVLVLGIVCGLAAVFWYGVTLLRLLAMGAIQESPASWGLAAAESDAAAG